MSARSIRRGRERQAERRSARHGRLTKQATLGAGAMLGATLFIAPAAQAATFQVTTTDDEVGAGTTPCTDDPGDCSLREAVDEANDNGADDTEKVVEKG